MSKDIMENTNDNNKIVLFFSPVYCYRLSPVDKNTIRSNFRSKEIPVPKKKNSDHLQFFIHGLNLFTVFF